MAVRAAAGGPGEVAGAMTWPGEAAADGADAAGGSGEVAGAVTWPGEAAADGAGAAGGPGGGEEELPEDSCETPGEVFGTAGPVFFLTTQ